MTDTSFSRSYLIMTFSDAVVARLPIHTDNLNLGLRPMAGAATMPDVCLLSKTNLNSIRDDPWHFLSYSKLMGGRGELSTRHYEVGRVVYRCDLLM